MLESFSITFGELNFFSIIPMVIAIVGAILIIGLDLYIQKANKQLYAMLAIVFLVLDLGYVVLFGGYGRAFFDLVLIDGISMLGQIIILVGAILFLPLTLSYNKFHEFQYPEYYALF